MGKCTNCGADNLDASKFCIGCGNPIDSVNNFVDTHQSDVTEHEVVDGNIGVNASNDAPDMSAGEVISGTFNFGNSVTGSTATSQVVESTISHAEPVVQSEVMPSSYNTQMHNQQVGATPNMGYNPQAGGMSNQGYNPQAGGIPNQGYNPQAGGVPNQGYNPQAGGMPNQGNDPQLGANYSNNGHQQSNSMQQAGGAGYNNAAMPVKQKGSNKALVIILAIVGAIILIAIIATVIILVSKMGHKSYTGFWRCNKIEGSDAEDFDAESMGIKYEELAQLVVNKDKTVSFVMFGEVMEGTYTNNGKVANVEFDDGYTSTMKIEEKDILVLDSEDTDIKVYFTRQKENPEDINVKKLVKEFETIMSSLYESESTEEYASEGEEEFLDYDYEEEYDEGYDDSCDDVDYQSQVFKAGSFYGRWYGYFKIYETTDPKLQNMVDEYQLVVAEFGSNDVDDYFEVFYADTGDLLLSMYIDKEDGWFYYDYNAAEDSWMYNMFLTKRDDGGMFSFAHDYYQNGNAINHYGTHLDDDNGETFEYSIVLKRVGTAWDSDLDWLDEGVVKKLNKIPKELDWY